MDEQFILTLLISYGKGQCTRSEIQQLEAWYRELGRTLPVPALAESERRALQEKIWAGITGQISAMSGVESREPARNLKNRYAYISVAAALLIVLSFMGYRWRVTEMKGEFRVVSTALGEIKKFELPDHSFVWLNGSSSLRFQADMRTERKLYLDEGEAFFDVHPDHEHPFIVKTADGLQIKVLGTAFSIKAYKNLTDEKVAVLRGRVMVENNGRQLAVLTKGQGTAVNRRNGRGTALRVDSAEVNGWTYGKLTLTDVSFRELSVAIENSYDTHILFLDPLLNEKRISISFSRSDKLGEILDALRTIYGISYEVDENSKTVRIRAR